MPAAFPSGAVGHRRRHLSRISALLCVAIAAALTVGVAPASAKMGISKLAAGPIAANTHCNPNLTPEQMRPLAATRTDFCLAFYTTGGDPAKGDDMKRVVASQPQGYLATADTSPNCSVAQFMPQRGEPARCPAESQIGEVEAIVRADFHGLTIPQTVHGKVWNIEHGLNEVATIGIELETELAGIPMPHNKLLGRTTLRPNPDVGLTTVIDNQPRTADLGSLLGSVPIVIDGFFMRLWGSKADHPSLRESFSLLGSDCTRDQVTTMVGTTYAGAQTTAEDRYRLTDCDKVPLQASTTLQTSERRPDVPTGATVTVRVGQERDPHFQGNLRKTVMTLPAGITMGPQVASGDAGLPLCTEAQFGWDRWGKADCPAGSKVADVSLVSPLQANEFNGAAYLGAQPAVGELPQLFIEGGFGDAIDAPRVKLRGVMSINDQGQLVTTLDNLPQVSFEWFRLTFRSGPHAPLITPRECGTTSGQMVSTPSSGRPDIVQPITLTIDEDCVDPTAVDPGLDVQPGSLQAGARAPLTVGLWRPDRSDRITAIVQDLPPGIVADLRLATECATQQAAAQACPASSRIGTATATAGVGPAPATVAGDVFLGQTQPGNVANLIISTAVKFGDLDLGHLNVPASLVLRPEDQGLRLTAQLPTTFKGIPLNLRSIAVKLDREQFSINPTSCRPLGATAWFASEHGKLTSRTDIVQMGGCQSLGFEPGIGLRIDGATNVGARPTVQIAVSLAGGGSNLRGSTVALPKGLAADVQRARQACPLAQWNAGGCGPQSLIGQLDATLGITNEPVAGVVHMVRIPDEILPGIGLQLTGRFATRLLGRVQMDTKSGQLMTRFDALPDVPLSFLLITMRGGEGSSLVATKSFCADGTATVAGAFVGQSGASATRTTTIDCPPDVEGLWLEGGSTRLSGSLRRGASLTVTAPPSTDIARVRFSLPRGVTVRRSKLTSKRRLRGASRVSVSKRRTLTALVPRAGRSSVTLKIPKGAVQFSRNAKRRSKWTVRVRVDYKNGKRQTVKLHLRR